MTSTNVTSTKSSNNKPPIIESSSIVSSALTEPTVNTSLKTFIYTTVPHDVTSTTVPLPTDVQHSITASSAGTLGTTTDAVSLHTDTACVDRSEERSPSKVSSNSQHSIADTNTENTPSIENSHGNDSEAVILPTTSTSLTVTSVTETDVIVNTDSYDVKGSHSSDSVASKTADIISSPNGKIIEDSCKDDVCVLDNKSTVEANDLDIKDKYCINSEISEAELKGSYGSKSGTQSSSSSSVEDKNTSHSKGICEAVDITGGSHLVSHATDMKSAKETDSCLISNDSPGRCEKKSWKQATPMSPDHKLDTDAGDLPGDKLKHESPEHQLNIEKDDSHGDQLSMERNDLPEFKPSNKKEGIHYRKLNKQRENSAADKLTTTRNDLPGDKLTRNESPDDKLKTKKNDSAGPNIEIIRDDSSDHKASTMMSDLPEPSNKHSRRRKTESKKTVEMSSAMEGKQPPDM